MGGRGRGSLEEAIKRSKAYADAGADVVAVPFVEPEEVPQVAEAVPVPVAVFTSLCPGAALSLHSGWATPSAARVQAELARKLFETGDLPVAELFPFDDKAELIGERLYGEIVGSARRLALTLRARSTAMSMLS